MQTISMRKAIRLVKEKENVSSGNFCGVRVKEFTHPQGKKDVCLIDIEFATRHWEVVVGYFISVDKHDEVFMKRLHSEEINFDEDSFDD